MNHSVLSNAHPVVSVVMTTYNHERFIRAAIESCLAQTFEDFELIVVNDGSTDGTEAIVRSFQDPRLVLISQENAGPSLATNAGIAAARGEFVALMSGDDMCMPTRLEREVALARSASGAVVFSHVSFIDGEGRELPPPPWADDLFNVSQLSRTEILRRFFETGNFLSAPSALIPRQLLLDAGAMQPCLFQLQDFELWTRLIQRAEFVIAPERLIRYRVHEHNLSRSSQETNNALQHESHLVYRALVDSLDPNFFYALYGRPHGGLEVSDLAVKLDKAFFLLQFGRPMLTAIANELLYQVLETEAGRTMARERYGFTPKAFWMGLKTDAAAPQANNLQGELHRLQVENHLMRHRLNRVTIKIAEKLLGFSDSTPALKRALWVFYGPVKKVVSVLNRSTQGAAKFGFSFSVAYMSARAARKLNPRYEAPLLGVAQARYAYHPLVNARLAQHHHAKGDAKRALRHYRRAFLGDLYLFIDHPDWLGQFTDLLRTHAGPSELPSVYRRLRSQGVSAERLDLHFRESERDGEDATEKASAAPATLNRAILGIAPLDEWLSESGQPRVNFAPEGAFEFQLPAVQGEPRDSEIYRLDVPPRFVATLSDVAVGPGFSVVSPEARKLIVYEPASHPKFGLVSGLRGLVTPLPGSSEMVWLSWQVKRRIQLPEAILLSGRCSFNFYHWLIEYLPRLKEIEARGGLSDVPVLVSNQMPFQHYEALSVFLSPDQPIVSLDPRTLAEVERLHVPSFSTYVPDDFDSPLWKMGVVSRAHVEFLRERVLGAIGDEASASSPRKVFLSRARNVGRAMSNEREIVKLCRDAGFTVVYPELMSFREQVECFRHADVIMGPSGAAFANVVFCRPGTRVYALTSERLKTFSNFANLATTVGCDFTLVTGPNDRPPEAFAREEDYAHSSYTVPLHRIRAVLSGL